MPNGNIHSASTKALIVATASAIVAYEVSKPEEIRSLLCYGTGLLLGLMLTPDLDHNSGTPSAHYFKKVPFIGSALAWLWTSFWRPYAWLMPHRSFWSHFPIVSTLIRALYFLFPAIAIGFNVSDPFTWWLLLMIFWGLCVSDIAHLILDKA